MDSIEKPNQVPLIDRELAWLAFNHRVLQEAADDRVPLFERMKFLAIYSSNLDEFFRVRVASIRSLSRLGKKSRKKLLFNPENALHQIHKAVHAQQKEFGRVYREEILPKLQEHGVSIIHADNHDTLTDAQRTFISAWFEEHVMPNLSAAFLREGVVGPFLRNRRLYLVVQLSPRLSRRPWNDSSLMEGEGGGDEDTGLPVSEPELPLAVVEIPSETLPRFIELPAPEGEHHVLMLDDVMRLCLNRIFPGFDAVGSWNVKLTRDAELYIEDEFSGDLVKKIKKSLHKRETGLPSRFLYDQNMPENVLNIARKAFDLGKDDLFPGGRFHNFSDFFGFPFPEKIEHVYPVLPPLPHPPFEEPAHLFEAIAARDHVLHFPYQSYDYVLRFLREAAQDPDVESVAITLYRVASNSAVAQTLIDAARSGKKVTAFVEVKARFDEESNIYWAGKMEAEGVHVHYSFPGLKVHSKLCVVTRKEGTGLKRYAYLATGNFNEKTARIYCDHALFTVNPEITEEVERVFQFLTGENPTPDFQHLLVAPFTLRNRLIELVDKEIAVAQRGEFAALTLKVNALEDPEMIDKLYQASQAGVQVRLIVRGICCLKPGVPELSENVQAISIVDRFLEHARLYHFHHGGDELLFVSSADWMKRNLSRRVEVAFPIYDATVKDELQSVLQMQWRDNQKARVLDSALANSYSVGEGERTAQAQPDTYSWIQQRISLDV